MILFILLFLIFSNISLSHYISPRQQTQEYLSNNESKNHLLNKILISIITDKIYAPYTLVYHLISQHTPQFEHKQIYKCFELIIQKNLREHNYYVHKKYLLEDK
jgi:hypothetical protein